MNLIIDEGNTHIKYGVFEEGSNNEVALYESKDYNAKEVAEIIKKHNVRHAIYSSVRGGNEDLIADVSHSVDFIQLTHETEVPLINKYRTPNTLGMDRLAACVGASSIAGKDANILVIDVGTAITYDIVSKGEYLGGNIAPGMQMRLNALHTFTAKLPQVDINTEWKEIGDDTQTAIYSGCYSGILHAIAESYRRSSQKFPKLLVFLTGGGSKYFESNIKIKIFAKENLLRIGLNRILNDKCQKE